jgi:hypothetical protein
MDGVTVAILFALLIGTGVFLYGWFFLARPTHRNHDHKK